jgi:hypothetical protein
MKLANILGALFFASMISISPSSAQDGSETSTRRTAEGAQKFLAEMAQSGGVSAVYIAGTQQHCVSDCKKWGGYTVSTYFVWQVERVESTSRCSTRIFFKPGSLDPWVNYQVSSGFKKPADIPFVDVDWSRSGGIDTYFGKGPRMGFRILFRRDASPVYGHWLQLGFDQVPKEARDRVGVAMEYLVDNCVPASTTGF